MAGCEHLSLLEHQSKKSKAESYYELFCKRTPDPLFPSTFHALRLFFSLL